MHKSTAAIRPSLRNAALRRNATAAGRSRPAVGPRFYATEVQQPAGSGSSHLVSGALGGGVVLLGAYGYYHFSGAKTAVNTVRQASQTAKDIKDKAIQSVPSSKAMLGMVRSAAHSYAAAFPGAAYLVDSTFDQIDKIAEKNGPEVERIVKEVYNDISKAAAKGGDNVTDQVMAAIQEAVVKIQKLSGELSESTLKPLLERNPQLKDAVYDSLNQINSFGDKYGPEAKKIADDTASQIKELMAGGVTVGAIAKATSLAKQKLDEVKKLGAKAGSEAYSKAAEGARPYLDKAPDVKKYLEDSLGGMKEYVGDDGIKLINDTYSELEAAGKKGDTTKLMEIVKKRVVELQKLAKDKGGDVAEAALDKAKHIPGADKLFEAVPSLKDLTQLRQLASEKGGDFEKLLNESYDEIKAVLEKRAKQAKELGEDAASEAKKKTGK